MLERDLITRNIQVLVKLLMKALGLFKDDPGKALEITDSYMDEQLLDDLFWERNGIAAQNDQLVKVHVDFFYLKAQLLYEKDKKSGLEALKKAKVLLENYNRLFPLNFPFDYYQKLSFIQKIISDNDPEHL